MDSTVQLDLRLPVRPRRAPQLLQRQPLPAHCHRWPEQHPAQEKKTRRIEKMKKKTRVLFGRCRWCLASVPSLSWQTVALRHEKLRSYSPAARVDNPNIGLIEGAKAMTQGCESAK
jgi:hypothetical protein